MACSEYFLKSLSEVNRFQQEGWLHIDHHFISPLSLVTCLFLPTVFVGISLKLSLLSQVIHEQKSLGRQTQESCYSSTWLYMFWLPLASPWGCGCVPTGSCQSGLLQYWGLSPWRPPHTADQPPVYSLRTPPLEAGTAYCPENHKEIHFYNHISIVIEIFQQFQ